ncbi:hypothetical protein DWX55_06285 [Collinsella sp. AF19-7AC]|uniref:nucleotidyltransferase family protein n=1 Tax=unclassified Collinsella TaxID=2637548 RepID=UPI000E51BDF8|nr:hypothetical protein DWX63_10745 [Collinsella sp. AF20-14LB]RGT03934.1 hypothetical protein DWX55_06285 [Collinsella sp. AF19-7AC]RGT30313.1 hypothetical protein DWX39_06420 [Collinsella sp. AF19-1LB]RHE27266.1 hypothetical protein DW754_06915 [Collinsella sp. AM29-10AC]
MKYLVEDSDNPAPPVQDYAEAKEIVRQVLGSHPSVKQAAMFGSFVRGEQTGSSDVDLLLQVDSKKAFEVVGIGLDLAERLGRDVDMLATLCGAQSGFIENLNREGRIIYSREL